MSIVPSGKTRLMMAQTIGNPLSEGFSDGEPIDTPLEKADSDYQFATYDDLKEIGKQVDNKSNLEDTNQFEEEINDGDVNQEEKQTLTDYIFNKMQSFGYLPRRLQEFKKKFVKESVSPDGEKDITVEIPDTYAPDEQGNIKTIESDDLNDIAKEINSKFGLYFNGADRSDGKWNIKFTSVSNGKEEKEEESQINDNLESTYGVSPKGNKKKKSAETIHEMIKSSKNDELINKLKIMIGD